MVANVSLLTMLQKWTCQNVHLEEVISTDVRAANILEIQEMKTKVQYNH
jgi:hypothetical protein